MAWKGGLAAMLVALGSVASGGAAAADIATLSCIADNVPDAERNMLRDSVRALVGGGPNRPPEAARAAVEVAALLCQEQHGWNDGARDAAKIATMTDIGLAGLAPLLAEYRIDLGDFRAAIASLSPEQRDGLLEKDRATIDAMLAALNSQGIVTNERRALELIGVVAVFVIHADRARRTFIHS